MNIKGSTTMHRRSCLREVSRSAAARFIRVGRYRARRAAGRVVLSSLVCAAGVMCATSARAEPNDDGRPKVTRIVTDEQNAGFSDFDPCIGGFVFGTAHQHTVFIDRSQPPNVDTTFRIHQNGEGTSTVMNDPAEYGFAFSGDTDIKSSTRNYTMTMETREHIIREDQHFKDLPGHRKDDYFVRTSSKISGLAPKPVFTRQTSETTCK